MQLAPRVEHFRRQMLPYLKVAKSLAADAIQWANRDLQTGILTETNNLNSEELTILVNKMHLPHYHFLILKNGYEAQSDYHSRCYKTTNGHKILALSPFASFYARKNIYNLLTDTEKDIISRLFPVGVNGFKVDSTPQSIRLYMEFNRILLNSLARYAQFFIFADCLSGDFNKECARYLRENFPVSGDRIFHTNKKHPVKYWKHLREVATAIIKKYHYKETASSWLNFYADNYEEQWQDKKKGLYGEFAHKFGKIRRVRGLDLFHIHKVPKNLIDQCREYYERTGEKALVVLMDDSISKFGCTARSITNQIGEYADVIILATMFEF